MQGVQTMLKDAVSVNPLMTPVGQRIDTASNKFEEDWGLYMEICDEITSSADAAKDAARAIRKKLSMVAGRNNAAILNILLILETCVKNCGRRFHLQIVKRDFLNELVALMNPKNEPSVAVQERVLSLIQTWMEAFRGDAELKEVEKVLLELKAKGVEFPAADLDTMVPIYTPAATHAPVRRPQPAPQPAPQAAVSPTAAARTNMSPLDKIRADLSMVEGNLAVFNEMMTTLTPGTAGEDDRALLDQLNTVCHQMQSRLTVLLGELDDEPLLTRLLSLNDELNSVFLRYERYERSQPRVDVAASQPQSRIAAPASATPAQPPPPAADDLIDWGPETNAANNANMDPAQMVFDDFANLNTAPSPPSYQTVAAITAQERSSLAQDDVADIEQWLQPAGPAAAEQTRNDSTTPAFDQFLTQRMSVAESLPSGDPASGAIPPPPPRRQINKDDDHSLFAL